MTRKEFAKAQAKRLRDMHAQLLRAGLNVGAGLVWDAANNLEFGSRNRNP